MFGKMFGRKSDPVNNTTADQKMEALLHALEEQSKQNPLIFARVAAKEVLSKLVAGMKDQNGVHVESLFCALGALAGYSCQASVRALALASGLPETARLSSAETMSGEHFFFGDDLNAALAESKYSVWSLAAGAAEQGGARDFPDLHEIFQHTAASIGSSDFGLPRVPCEHRAGDVPLNYLGKIWPWIFPSVTLYCRNPEDWPIAFGLAIQEAIDSTKNMIAPAMALKIVMESAVPMSKVDIASLADL